MWQRPKRKICQNVFKCFQATRKHEYILSVQKAAALTQLRSRSVGSSERPKKIKNTEMCMAPLPAEKQVTLPELTSVAQRAFPPPGMLAYLSLRTRISWWELWLNSAFLRLFSVFLHPLYLMPLFKYTPHTHKRKEKSSKVRSQATRRNALIWNDFGTNTDSKWVCRS